MTSRRDVYTAINYERDRQDAKWGSQRDLPGHLWMTILTEEVGEAAKEVLERRHNHLRMELTQVAAVAVCWLEALGDSLTCALCGLGIDDGEPIAIGSGSVAHERCAEAETNAEVTP